MATQHDRSFIIFTPPPPPNVRGLFLLALHNGAPLCTEACFFMSKWRNPASLCRPQKFTAVPMFSTCDRALLYGRFLQQSSGCRSIATRNGVGKKMKWNLALYAICVYSVHSIHARLDRDTPFFFFQLLPMCGYVWGCLWTFLLRCIANNAGKDPSTDAVEGGYALLMDWILRELVRVCCGGEVENEAGLFGQLFLCSFVEGNRGRMCASMGADHDLSFSFRLIIGLCWLGKEAMGWGENLEVHRLPCVIFFLTRLCVDA